MHLTKSATVHREPEAAAVHCAHLTNLHHLKPSQNFMICDAGGGTVVRINVVMGFPSSLNLAFTGFGCLQNFGRTAKPRAR